MLTAGIAIVGMIFFELTTRSAHEAHAAAFASATSLTLWYNAGVFALGRGPYAAAPPDAPGGGPGSGAGRELTDREQDLHGEGAVEVVGPGRR